MSRRIKVAILGDFPIGKVYSKYADRTSFYPTWLYNLFEAFSESDEFDIHWIVVDKIIQQKETLQIRNQTFHLAPGTGLTIGLYTAYWYNRRQVSKIVNEIKPDLFHGWGTERFYGLAAKDFKGISLLSVQGLLRAYCKRAPMSSFARKQSFYEKGVLKSVDYITTESPWAEDRVREDVPSANIFPFDYAVEDVFFHVERDLSVQPSCLMACSNSNVKNIPLAIAAFSRSELRHVKLYLAGVRKYAYKNLPENIIPLGVVNRSDLVKLYAQVWCFVHTSKADTGPTAVKEARVAGLPVIVTNECGAKRLVEQGRSGYVIPANDEDALMDAVKKVVCSKETSLEMGAYQQEQCRSILCVNTMLQNIVRIYKNILKHHSTNEI